jgi:hypothetical protein
MFVTAYSDNLVISAVLLEIQRIVALMAINNQQTVATNSTRLCMRVKVLKLVKTKLVVSLAVLRDSTNLILGQIFLFVLV